MSVESFIQETGWRETSVGPCLYLKVRRHDDAPMTWTELWRRFADAYPGQWAVQFFPPREALVDEANVYHLFVLETPPHGVDIGRR
jgi:hypothetical protein